MVCQGHSLIYTLTHLTPPALPGFNTIIFGLNLRSAGFYCAPLHPEPARCAHALYVCDEG